MEPYEEPLPAFVEESKSMVLLLTTGSSLGQAVESVLKDAGHQVHTFGIDSDATKINSSLQRNAAAVISLFAAETRSDEHASEVAQKAVLTTSAYCCELDRNDLEVFLCTQSFQNIGNTAITDPSLWQSAMWGFGQCAVQEVLECLPRTY